MEEKDLTDIILTDISRVWHVFKDETKRFVAESIGGKREANEVIAILNETNSIIRESLASTD